MSYEPKGLYLEEFEVGKVYISQGRTITEADVVNFAGLSGDFNVLHTNDEFAKTGPFKERVAHGMLGASIMTGLSNMLGIFDGTTIAFWNSPFVTRALFASAIQSIWKWNR